MRYRLLDIVCCPACGGSLALEVLRAEPAPPVPAPFGAVRCRERCGLHGRPAAQAAPSDCDACYRNEVVEGVLGCSCGRAYPVIGGVPRLLPDELLAESLVTYHADFLARHRERFRHLVAPAGARGAKARTMHAFSYQWTTFVENFDYFRDIFLGFVRPFLEPRDFDGKLVLEAGCGSGRPASVAASFGAEVVAVDLSEAVQSAHAMTKHYPLLHVVQGDIYSLPVRPCFDLVYSVGVLQHLPDPAAAFRRIGQAVPAGRPLVVWVYGVREAWYAPIEWLRGFTVKWPYRLLHALSFVLAIASELFLLLPYRVLSRIPSTRALAERIPGRIYARFPFKENVLGWFDRLGAPVTHYFTRPQVEAMLRDAGFADVQVVARPDASASWVGRGIRVGETGT